MAKVRFVVIKVTESFYVGNPAELEELISKNYEIASSCALRPDTILFTLVMK